MPKTSFKTTAGWKTIPWQQLEKKVFKLQKRIFKASVRGDVKTVRQLQKTLIQSHSARCLAVRQAFSQEKKGTKTNQLISSQGMKLVEILKLGKKGKPIRVSKISLIYHCALQALLTMAIKPEWEARLEPNLVSNLPLQVWDAIRAIYISINSQSKYVLNVDISECFDCIDRLVVLDKLNTYPSMRRQIKTWLKFGIKDRNKYWQDLLLNIALNDLTNRLIRDFNLVSAQPSPKFVRYADKFVILHSDLAVIYQCQQIIFQWLGDMGWELKPDQTKISHTFLNYEQQKPGFDFLGFNIKQQAISGKKLGFKTIIQPSKENIQQHWKEISRAIALNKSAAQADLIQILIPKIQRWVNYYQLVNNQKVFGLLDTLMWNKLRAWAKRRHPKKSNKYWIEKYWHKVENQNWVFSTQKNGQIEYCLPKYVS
jgi:RNA-directed DNA polymerase